MKEIPEERLPSMDVLRAVMMLLGVVLHGIISYSTQAHGASWPFSYGDSPVNASWPYQEPGSIYLFDLAYDFIHLFRMPLFFLLSGFFSHLSLSKKGVKVFIRGRKKRILYPFLVFWPLVFVMVGAGMMFLMGGIEKRDDFVNEQNFMTVLSPLHLWFLYYLLFFYGLILGFYKFLKSFPEADAFVHRVFALSFKSPFAVIIFSIPLIGLLVFFQGKISAAVNFLPDARAMSLYFLFFLFGWLLYKVRKDLKRFEKNALLHLIVGIVCFVVLQRFDDIKDSSGLWLVSALSAICVWGLIFSFMGLSLKFFNTQSKVFSYLVDSSYWLYVMHLPLVVWLVVGFKGMNLSTPIKASLVISLTLIVLLGVYEYGVRRTFIGRFLNGR